MKHITFRLNIVLWPNPTQVNSADNWLVLVELQSTDLRFGVINTEFNPDCSFSTESNPQL